MVSRMITRADPACTSINLPQIARQAIRSRKRTQMVNPSILSSVHALETAFPEGCEIVCANPLCSITFKPGGVPNNPKRFCGGSCKQQASILRRAAKLLEALPDDQAIRILRE